MPDSTRNRKYAGVILLALFIFIAYSYRLYFPPEAYYDEVHYVKFLKGLMHDHTYDYVSSHPPLWHLLTWGCMALFGEFSSVWRMVSLLAGLMLILWVYLLAKKVSRDYLTAVFAALIFTLDCISLTQARIGMLNSLTLLFMMLSLWAFLRYWLNREWPRRKALCITGIFLGLALATKMAALSMFGIIYLLVALRAINVRQERRALFLESLLFLAALPIAIYFAVFVFVPFLPGHTWKDIWRIQVFNFHYHLQEAGTQTHPYASQWWGWPLLLRPIWYYYAEQEGLVRGIICIGNPVVFWMIPVMVAYLAWDLLRHKTRISGLILLGFFGQWLFYTLSSRLKYFHYMYFSMPFVAFGLAYISRQLWEKGKIGKFLVCLYLALVLGMFIYWYPLLTGLPIPAKFYQHHMWFRSWI